MSSKGPGGGKFPEPVTDHGLGDKNRDVNSAIVDTNCDADKIGRNLAVARPSFNRVFAAGIFGRDNFGQKFLVNVGSFFRASSHD